jgi:acid phosphatase
VPFPQFATDQGSGRLPNFSFLLPNQVHNAHDCQVAGCTLDDKLAAADNWLASVVPPLLSDLFFQANGVLIITFDEAEQSDSTNGGGRIFTLFLGPRVKQGYSSVAFYQHQNILKTILRALGGSGFPGLSNSAAEMGEFFE